MNYDVIIIGAGPGGIFAAAWIALVSGVIFMGRSVPELIVEPSEAAPLAAFLKDGSWGGQAFTQAYFTAPQEVLPFMEQFIAAEYAKFKGQ